MDYGIKELLEEERPRETLGIDMLDNVIVGEKVVSMKSTTSNWR